MKKKTKDITIISACIGLSAMVLFGQSATYASPQAQIEKSVGYRLMVDGTSWGVVEDKAELTQVLEDYKTSTLKAVSGDVAVESSEFQQLIEVNEVAVDASSFITSDKIKEKIQSEETSEIYYTVKAGDTVWTIAKAKGIPVATLLNLNPTLNPEKINAGQKILFQPKNPVIDVVADVQSTIVQPVAHKTEYVNDATLTKGKTVVVKKGVAGSKKITYDIHLVNGYIETKTIVKEEQVLAPVNTVIKVGTKVIAPKPKAPNVNTSWRNYGVVTGRLSSNFGYRSDPFSGKWTFHTGIDIATSYGSPVVSYAGGKVVASTSNSVRGNYVTIDHGNGLKTSYLHLSSRLVKVGQTVTSGQLIGKVGSTGSATGNHLHFTVIKNGIIVSPWSYV